MPQLTVQKMVKVTINKPLGLRIADEEDGKITILEVNPAGGAATWNEAHTSDVSNQIQVGAEITAFYVEGSRTTTVGKCQEDIVEFVSTDKHKQISLEVLNPKPIEKRTRYGIDAKLAKELTYVVELAKPLGLVIGSGPGAVRVLQVEERGSADLWNALVESDHEFERVIKPGDRLIAYYQTGDRVEISNEQYTSVLKHIKQHKGDTIELEFLHENPTGHHAMQHVIQSVKKAMSQASMKLQQTIHTDTESYFVDLGKPFGMTIGAVGDRVIVTKIEDRGNAAAWNALMAKDIDGRHPNVRNQLFSGDQVVGVYEQGQRLDMEISYRSLVNYVRTHKQKSKITLQMKHLPPGLFRQKTSWKTAGHPSLLRTAGWRLYLGAMDPGAAGDPALFEGMLKRQRQAYTILEAKWHVHTAAEIEEIQAEVARDPLRETHEHQLWGGIQANMSILETLRKDITRTFNDLAFFQKPDTQAMLERILFVWYKEQAGDSEYQQGMHELLAVVVMALLKDLANIEHSSKAEAEGPAGAAETTTAGEPSADEKAEVGEDADARRTIGTEWRQLVSAEHLEADSYTMFASLMHMVLPFYTGASHLQGQGDHQQPFLYFRVQQIHYVLLQRYDPELFNHLEDAMVLPHLYLIRWLRLLFTREFNIEQSFVIWDTILQSKGLELVDYVCVAMLSFIRADLLAEDAAHCLTKVFHYPRLSNAQVLEMLRIAKGLFDGLYTSPHKTGLPQFLRKATSGVSSALASAANSIKTLSVSTITQGQNQQNVSSGNPGAFPSAQQGAPPSAAAFSITTSHSHSAAIASIATPAVAPAAAAPAEDQEEKKIEILTALTTSPEAEALLGGLVETKETSGIDITDTPARAEDQAGEEAASAPKPKSQKKGKSKGKGKDKGKGEGKADTQEF